MNINDVYLHSSSIVIERVFKRLALDLTRMCYQVGFENLPESLSNDYLRFQIALDKKVPGRSAELLKEAEAEVKGTVLKEHKEKQDKDIDALTSKARKLNKKIATYMFGSMEVPKSLHIDYTRTLLKMDKLAPGMGDLMHEVFEKERSLHVKKIVEFHAKNQDFKV